MGGADGGVFRTWPGNGPFSFALPLYDLCYSRIVYFI